MRHVDRLLTSFATETANAQEAQVRAVTAEERSGVLLAVLQSFNGTADERAWTQRAELEWRRMQPPERKLDPITLWLIGLLVSICVQLVVRWWLNHRDTRQRQALLQRWAKGPATTLFESGTPRDEDEYE